MTNVSHHHGLHPRDSELLLFFGDRGNLPEAGIKIQSCGNMHLALLSAQTAQVVKHIFSKYGIQCIQTNEYLKSHETDVNGKFTHLKLLNTITGSDGLLTEACKNVTVGLPARAFSDLMSKAERLDSRHRANLLRHQINANETPRHQSNANRDGNPSRITSNSISDDHSNDGEVGSRIQLSGAITDANLEVSIQARHDSTRTSPASREQQHQEPSRGSLPGAQPRLLMPKLIPQKRSLPQAASKENGYLNTSPSLDLLARQYGDKSNLHREGPELLVRGSLGIPVGKVENPRMTNETPIRAQNDRDLLSSSFLVKPADSTTERPLRRETQGSQQETPKLMERSLQYRNLGMPLEQESWTGCKHPGKCSSKNCSCLKSKTMCRQSCGCNEDCNHRISPCVHDGPCARGQCECADTLHECTDQCLCQTCENKFTNRSSPALSKRVSTLEGAGHGLFAEHDIPAGTWLGSYGLDRVVSRKAQDENLANFPLSKNHAVVGSGSLTYYINHSEDPNAEFIYRETQTGRKIMILTLKFLQSGQEIFINYDPSHTFSFQPIAVLPMLDKEYRSNVAGHISIGNYVKIHGENDPTQKQYPWIGRVDGFAPAIASVTWLMHARKTRLQKPHGMFELVMTTQSQTIWSESIYEVISVLEGDESCRYRTELPYGWVRSLSS